MIILIHSSKTMRPPPEALGRGTLGVPALLERSTELITYLRTLSDAQLGRMMAVSAELAARTKQQYAEWSAEPQRQSPAATAFVGDIYSGLQVDTFSAADRAHADHHLRILSGLYGILRPFDGVCPYRLEMGYRLPATAPNASLYRFWGGSIAAQLPADGRIVNLAANEYSKAVLPHVDAGRVVTPRFLTVDPASGRPKFVVVHAKIARGALARWLVRRRVADAVEDPVDVLCGFDDIGYRYDEAASTPAEPTFVCQEFGGKGLSVRLT
ncbi:YaaA family protein [Micromonospora sp. LOL_023]|uniref:YaaA family protein n=1 Tax=Micromonospora sp. LOL_023 TaxID=3345418 RepID=UPI003A88BF66